MIKHFAISLAVALLSGTAIAQSLEDFAALPGVFQPRLSEDGRYLAVGCRSEDRTRVCLYDLDEGGTTKLFGVPEPLFQDGFYFAGPDHLIVQGWFNEAPPMASGGQMFRLRRAMVFNIHTGQAAEFMNNNTDDFDNRRVVSLDNTDPGSVIVAFEGRRHRVDLETGRGQRMRRIRTDGIPVYQPDGRMSATIEFGNYDDMYFFRGVDENGDETDVLYEGSHPLDYPRYHGVDPNGDYILSFLGGEHLGVRRIDAQTGEMTPLSPETAGDIYTPLADPATRNIIGYSRYRDDLAEAVFLDDGLQRDSAALARALRVDRVLFHTWSRDRDRMVFSTVSAGEPHSYFLYERSAGNISPIGFSRPELEGVATSSVDAFDFIASDGLAIPGFLTLPPGHDADDGPLPLVVMPHGGPWARDDRHFDWWAQAYASQGYAVYQPNFRGSFGYGTAFQEAGFGEFGGRMIEDILEGAQALRDQGFAQQGPACFVGASYGGYAALMAAIVAPDDVACVVAFSPVTDPISILGDAARLRANRDLDFWQQYIGDRFMGAEAEAAISPLRRADELRAPTLLMHGDEDFVINIEESEAFERAMRGRDGFRFVEMEGVTHSPLTSEARLQILQESLQLIDETLK